MLLTGGEKEGGREQRERLLWFIYETFFAALSSQLSTAASFKKLMTCGHGPSP